MGAVDDEGLKEDATVARFAGCSTKGVNRLALDLQCICI